MQVTEYKAEYRLSQWSEIIREQKQSGKNVREWCLEHGMTTNAYYYRLRRVRESVYQRNHAYPQKKNQPTASQRWAVSYQHLISGSNRVKILTTEVSRL